MKRFLVFAAIAVTGSAIAAPFSVSGPGAQIPDNTAAGITTTGVFSGAPGLITGIQTVTVRNLTHTWVGDLRGFVTFGGFQFTLFQHVADDAGSTFGENSDLNGTYVFDVVSTRTIQSEANLVDAGLIAGGAYRAAHQVNETLTTVGLNSVNSDGNVFNGLDPNGTWSLTFADRAAADVGGFGDWTLEGTYSAVPEPATLAVLGIGAAAMLRRRRK